MRLLVSNIRQGFFKAFGGKKVICDIYLTFDIRIKFLALDQPATLIISMNWFGLFQYIHSYHIGNQCHGNYETDPDTEKTDTVTERVIGLNLWSPNQFHQLLFWLTFKNPCSTKQPFEAR